MFSYVLVFIVGIIEAIGAAGALFFVVAKNKSEIRSNLGNLSDECDQKEAFKKRIAGLYASMVSVPEAKKALKELGQVEESLKAERGRITITQAELETVDTRLRELEEIERELEASGLETKEELNILKKKEAELSGSNEKLKQKIASSLERFQALMSELEMSAQVQEQVTAMHTQLMATNTQIDTLLLQIEQGNEQYFILKQRYDALDIEYAQLYEKFSDSED